MKFFVHTTKYGDRVGGHIGYYGTQIFFEDPAPEPDTFVTIEMPGLSALTPEAAIKWITDRSGTDPNDRRQIHEIPKNAWRAPVLDDFVDAENHQQFVWWVNRQFDIDDIRTFEDEHVANVHERLDEIAGLPVSTLEERKARETAYANMQDRVMRLYSVLGQMPATVNMRLYDMRRDNDAEQLDRDYPKPFDLDVAMALAKRLSDQWTRAGALRRVAKDIAILPDDEARALAEQLMQHLKNSNMLRDTVSVDVAFYNELQGLLVLDHCFDGEELDIAQAVEEVIPLNFDTWNAPRIGRIVPGRRALVIRSISGRIEALVRGQRKLKHRVAQSQNGLVRHGVRLVVSDAETSSLDAELLQVERLMTLAQVDPVQVVDALREHALPDSHPVWRAAELAPTDPRWASVLADLAIEVVVGIDADVARGMLARQRR